MTNHGIEHSRLSPFNKYFYQNIFKKCTPKRFRNDKTSHQQLTADLLYAYDPSLREVSLNNEQQYL